MFKRIAYATAASLLASTANAQSFPPGFYFSGEVEGSYLTDSDDSYTTQTLELNFGYTPAGVGSIPIGFELDSSYIALQSAGVGSDSIGPVTRGVVFYDTSFGRLSVGAPHAAMDDYLNAPTTRLSGIFGGELSILTGSLSEFIPIFEPSNMYGARFDGSSGSIDYGISYHSFNHGDLESITAGAQYARDNYVLSGGFESLLDEDDVGYFGSVEFDFGLYGTQVFVGKPVIGDGVYYQIEGVYRPFETVEMSAGYASYEDGAFDYYYVDAEYSSSNGIYVGASYANASEFEDAIAEVYAGWRFNYGG